MIDRIEDSAKGEAMATLERELKRAHRAEHRALIWCGIFMFMCGGMITSSVMCAAAIKVDRMILKADRDEARRELRLASGRANSMAGQCHDAMAPIERDRDANLRRFEAEQRLVGLVLDACEVGR